VERFETELKVSNLDQTTTAVEHTVGIGVGAGPAERTVHTAAQYRAMAEECFQWAETATDEKVRANYLGSAQIWLEAAARLDGGLPVRGKVIPKHSNGKWNEPRAKL
jgi:hypothetical protein